MTRFFNDENISFFAEKPDVRGSTVQVSRLTKGLKLRQGRDFQLVFSKFTYGSEAWTLSKVLEDKIEATDVVPQEDEQHSMERQSDE